MMKYYLKGKMRPFEKGDYAFGKLYERWTSILKSKTEEFEKINARLVKIQGKKKKQEEAAKLKKIAYAFKEEIETLEKKLEALEALCRKYSFRKPSKGVIMFRPGYVDEMNEDEQALAVSKTLCETFELEFAEELKEAKKEIEREQAQKKSQEEKDDAIIADLDNILK